MERTVTIFIMYRILIGYVADCDDGLQIRQRSMGCESHRVMEALDPELRVLDSSRLH